MRVLYHEMPPLSRDGPCFFSFFNRRKCLSTKDLGLRPGPFLKNQHKNADNPKTEEIDRGDG
jgi:hypothetical protein